MERTLKAKEFNPIDMMVGSGARGNMLQVRQIAGMRGLVANPRGDMIPRPIKSNFREGLTMLEYFISTPGARKGLVDTALRTADSGYLTRRLVDVAQELIINDEDPSSGRPGARHLDRERRARLGRQAHLPGDPAVLPHAGRRRHAGRRHRDRRRHDRRPRPMMGALRDDPTIDRVRVLSPLTDDCRSACAPAAYGLSLATGREIEMGEAVGVIAAQSIGEPGTQLTMRTFHTGGIAGARATSPAVCPAWSSCSRPARPKNKAILSRTRA